MAWYTAHRGEAPGTEDPRDRLGEGTAPFTLWKRGDLPPVWAQHFTDSHICVSVELPDTPWGRAYYSWACNQLGLQTAGTDAVPVMLTSMYDFQGLPEHSQRIHEARNCLQALLETGRPPQHFARLLDCPGA